MKSSAKKEKKTNPSMHQTKSIFDDDLETEMVTLEKIENQKNQLLKRYYPKTTRRNTFMEREIRAQTLLLNNITFGLKSRFEALLHLLEGDLAGRVRHFILSGSTITMAKFDKIMDFLTENCAGSLHSLVITDLNNPLKRSSIDQIINLVHASKCVLTIERC